MKRVEENTALRDSINGLELVVSLSGYAVLDRSWYGNDICTPFNKLYLIESGEGYLRTEGETVIMKPGMAYFVPTRTNHSYGCEDALTKLFFHLNLFRSDRYDLFRGVEKILEIPMPPDLLTVIQKAYVGNAFGDGMIVREQLYRILNLAVQAYGLARNRLPAYSHYVSESISYILGNLSARLQVETLARRCFVSKSYLEKRFRKEVGVSIGRYIDDQLICAAQEKLEQTGDSVAAIGQSLGFADACYFSRRFKQLCGITPLHYRRLRRLHAVKAPKPQH